MIHAACDSIRRVALTRCPVMAVIFVPQANEKYYDLGGALGFMTSTLVSLYYPSLKARYWYRLPGVQLPPITSFSPRQLLLSAAVVAWSTRLGSFLVTVSDVLSEEDAD